MLAAGTLDVARAGRAARRRLGLRAPAAAGARPGDPTASRPGRSSGQRAAASGCRWPAPASGADRGAAAGAARLRRGAVRGAAVVLLAADLFRANMGFNPAIRTADAVPPTTGAIRYLQSQRAQPVRRRRARPAHLSRCRADLSMHFGLYDARGYDYPVEKRYDVCGGPRGARASATSPSPRSSPSATPAALRALSLLSVSDLLVGPLQATPAAARAGPAASPTRARTASSTRNANALPRVFVVDRQQTVAGDNAAAGGRHRAGVRRTRRRGHRATAARYPAGRRHRRAACGRERAARLLRRREGRDRRDAPRHQPGRADRLVLPRVEGDRRRQAGLDRARRLRAAGGQRSDPATTRS